MRYHGGISAHEQLLNIMDEQPTASNLPLPLLILGFIVVVGCAIWTGCLFSLYGGSILYGVMAGIFVGAAYAFAKQIKLRLFP